MTRTIMEHELLKSVHNRVTRSRAGPVLLLVSCLIVSGAGQSLCPNGFGSTFQTASSGLRLRLLSVDDSNATATFGIGCAFNNVSSTSLLDCESRCVASNPCQAYEFDASEQECYLVNESCNCTASTGAPSATCARVALFDDPDNATDITSRRRDCVTPSPSMAPTTNAPTSAPTEEIFCAGTSFSGPVFITLPGQGSVLVKPMPSAGVVGVSSATVSQCQSLCLASTSCGGFDIAWPQGTSNFTIPGNCTLVRDSRLTVTTAVRNVLGVFYTRISPACIYGATSAPTTSPPTASPTSAPTFDRIVTGCTYSVVRNTTGATALLDTSSQNLLPTPGVDMTNVTNATCAMRCSQYTEVSSGQPACRGYQLVYINTRPTIQGVCFLVAAANVSLVPPEQVLGSNTAISGFAYQRGACTTVLRTQPPTASPTVATCPVGSALSGQTDLSYCAGLVADSGGALCVLFINACPNSCNAPGCRPPSPTAAPTDAPTEVPTTASPTVFVPGTTTWTTTTGTTTTGTTVTSTMTTTTGTTTTTTFQNDWLCEGIRDPLFCLTYSNLLKPDGINCLIDANNNASFVLLTLCPALCNGTALSSGVLANDPDNINGTWAPCAFDAITSTTTQTTTTTVPTDLCGSFGLPGYVHDTTTRQCIFVGPASTQTDANATCMGHHRNTTDGSNVTIGLAVASSSVLLSVLDATMRAWTSPVFATPVQAWLGASSTNAVGGTPFVWTDRTAVNTSLFAPGQPDGSAADAVPQACVATAARANFSVALQLSDEVCSRTLPFFCAASIDDLRVLAPITVAPTAVPTAAPTLVPTAAPTSSPTAAPDLNCTNCAYNTTGTCRFVNSEGLGLCFAFIPEGQVGAGTCLPGMTPCVTASPTSAPTASPTASSAPTAAPSPCGARCGSGVVGATAACIVQTSAAASLNVSTDFCAALQSNGTCATNFDRCGTATTPAPTIPPLVTCTGCTLLGSGPHTCRGSNPDGNVLPEYCTAFQNGTTSCPVDFTRCIACQGCTGGSPGGPYTCRGAASGPVPSTLCTTFVANSTTLQCPQDFEVCPGIL
eukprot:m.180417 g.180417  ORF g.180417 m.180417 type:complete len:1060 (+) comp15002_c0_seq1:194-3373(+)